MEMRTFAYNSNILLVMATLTINRNEAINKELDDEGDNKEYILAGLREACKEINLARKGLAQAIDADVYIKMLEDEDRQNASPQE